MQVVSVPFRLRLSSLALFICVPMVVAQVIIVSRAPWWNLPYKIMGYWAWLFICLCIPLYLGVCHARKWAFKIIIGLSGVWVLTSGVMAMRTQQTSLGFFFCFLLALLLGEIFWLRYELKRSFMDPKVQWFQGMPKAIPRLRCQVSLGGKNLDLSVSRFDEDGAYLFYGRGEKKFEKSLALLFLKKKLQMVFSYRDQKISCLGLLTSSACDGMATWIRFVNLSLDSKKKVGDFLEGLRGEGYV